MTTRGSVEGHALIGFASQQVKQLNWIETSSGAVLSRLSSPAPGTN